jgi:hypothetical protein
MFAKQFCIAHWCGVKQAVEPVKPSSLTYGKVLASRQWQGLRPRANYARCKTA